MISSVSQKTNKLSQRSVPDYYNYYYGGYNQNPEASDTQEGLNLEAAVEAADVSEAAEVSAPDEAAAATVVVTDVSGQPENSVAPTTEVGFIKKLF